MQFAKGAVGLHLSDDGIDKDEKVVLPLTHQHTNLAMSEGITDKRCGEARVVLHIPRSLSDFGNHNISIALCHLIRNFLILLPDDDGGMRQVLVGKLLV